MTTLRERLLTGATLLMVCMAAASTIYTIRRQNMVRDADAAVVVQHQSDWRSYVTEHNAFGPPNAPVTIVEFADFQCPFCESLKWSVDTLLAHHPNDVRFVFRHFPLPIHRFAIAAATASECAGEQGRFKPMFDELFGHQDSLGIAPFSRFARSAGVTDLAAFDACVARAAPVAAIARDTADAIRLRAEGTPTLLINDLRIEGVVSLDSLEAFVARAKAASSR